MAFDISKCAGCPLAGCGRPAELVGNPKAPYMVVTDVPTTFAASKGRLMSERASSILSEELSKHGFRRDDFLFVPQVRCAHEADSYTTKEKTLIRKTCRGHFLDAVSEFKPEVILPLGATPATQVVGRSVKITKVRGVPSHSEEHDCMVLALLHPGQVAMYPQHHPVFAADVASFRRLVDSGYDVEASSNAMMGDYKIVDDLEFLIEQQPSIVCIDTEDTSLEYFKKGTFNVRDYDEAIHGKQEPDAAVLTIQLCIKPGEAYMVVWDHPERPASPRQKKKLREQLRRLLCRRDVRVIGQNVKFDVTYLATHLDMLLRIGGDTLMLATLLDENMLQRNLDILTKHYVPEMAGYADCVHPSTLMLMEDLTKKPASAIRVGDRLVGFEEEADGGSSRKMVDTVVESVRTLRMVSLRVVMDSGECIQVSANHQFLRGPRNTGNGGSWVWRSASSLAVGDKLKLFPFPDEDRSYDAGWLSGILDGEGYATTHGPAGLRLGFSQKRGPVQERASRLFNGGDCQVSWDLRKDLANVTVTGARAMRELIRLRPIRLVGKKPWIGKSLFVGEGTHSRIRSIEYVGVQDVVSIQTTSHTFVAAGFATHNCFNASVDKSRMWTVPLRKMVPYGCGDADAAFRLYHALWKLVAEDDKLVRHYRYVSLPGLNTLASMEMRGLNVDDGALVAFEKLLAESVDRQYQELLAQVPRSIKRVHIDKGLSFSRGDFVRDILFSHKDGFRLKPKVFTKTTAKLPTHLRVPSTSSKDHLPYFFDECPFTMALSQYVKDERLLSTSVRGFKTKYIHDGMVRPTYSLTVTVTGRTSSENPNGQNFPKRGNNAKAYRRSYVAPPGYVVLEADLSQAELRISADMAQDRVMLKVYNEGGDIHSTTAATTLNVPGAVFAQWGQDKRKLIDCANEIAGSGDFLRKLNPGQRREATVKDYYKAKRQEAKAINFGFIYGMGWRKFVGYAKTQYGVEFTDAEAEAIRTAYFKKYGALTGWHERTRAYAKTHKQVRSYSGRIRHLPMIDSDDDAIQSEASRQAINSPVQEFGSSLGVMAMGRLHERMDDRYIAPIAFVHDAIYVLVPIEYAIWGAQTLKWYMQTNPIEKWFGIRMSCPIVADVSIGFNLGDTYEMEGLTVDEEYDYASLWDEEKQSGIKLPPQRIPPNNGTRSKPVYTYVD